MRGRFAASKVEDRKVEDHLKVNLKRATPDERDVRALTAKTNAKTPFPPFPADAVCVARTAPSTDRGAAALRAVRRLPESARRAALTNIVAAVAHCHALGVVVAIHAELTRVSREGDARISLDLAPDARYSAPETLFGLSGGSPGGNPPGGNPSCVAWSLACLLVKLITGNPLVRDGTKSEQIARALRLVGALRVRDAHLAAFFDALDATQWKDRAPRLTIPRAATPRERDVIARSLRWSDRSNLEAFTLARSAHTPSLESTPEE